MSLPKWAIDRGEKLGRREIAVLTDEAYPAMLKLLEAPTVDPRELTDDWKEIAYQAIKLELQGEVGFAANFHFIDPERRWKQSDPVGTARRAAKTKAVRTLYSKLRGGLPT